MIGAVVLVGHGGVPTDLPRELVRRLKALEGMRQASGAPPSDEERALDARIRHWPRTSATDPYRAGLQALAGALRPRLAGARLEIAYNEFCAPSLPEAVDGLVADGVTTITVVPSMLTPGGSHSEIEIPAALAELRSRHPHVALHYAWPVDMELLADMLASHLETKFTTEAPSTQSRRRNTESPSSF
jgi:sirohydrochlorin cobaltochelatase